MSYSLQPHGLQHTRPLCPSQTPGVYLNSCPLSQWCHPTTSSIVPFSSCPQSFPAWGSFPMSWLFALDGQSIGASASIFPVNIPSWFPLGLTGLILLAVQETPLELTFFSKQMYLPVQYSTIVCHRHSGFKTTACYCQSESLKAVKWTSS